MKNLQCDDLHGVLHRAHQHFLHWPIQISQPEQTDMKRQYQQPHPRLHPIPRQVSRSEHHCRHGVTQVMRAMTRITALTAITGWAAEGDLKSAKSVIKRLGGQRKAWGSINGLVLVICRYYWHVALNLYDLAAHNFIAFKYHGFTFKPSRTVG